MQSTDYRLVYTMFYTRSLHMHVDGHHKLIRWRLITHCGIDGYTRLVVYLQCSANNCFSTVYSLFLKGTELYELPSRVRCDQGGENVQVAQHMLEDRG